MENLFFHSSAFSEQLIVQSNQFDTAVTFSEQLFLQSCYFFGIATFSGLSLLLSSFFFFSEQQRFQSETSTEQLLIENRLIRTATFQRTNLFNQYIQVSLVQNKDICRRATFLKKVILYSIKFFRTATFSVKLILQKRCL